MTELAVITEDFEEEFDECPEPVQMLLAQLRTAKLEVEQSVVLTERLQAAEARVCELNRLCTDRSTEIYHLQERTSVLATKLQDKEQELRSLVEINREFKDLVGVMNKGIQTNVEDLGTTQLQERDLQCSKYKDMIVKLLEDNQSLKDTLEKRNEWESPSNGVRDIPNRNNPQVKAQAQKAGYIPSNQRKLKNPIL